MPAYNIVHMRSPGAPFHPKGDGNGYILTFGDKRVYVAGDTENIPEMKGLGPDRRRLPADEPPLHDDAGDGGRCRPDGEAGDPLPLPYHGYGHVQTSAPAEG